MLNSYSYARGNPITNIDPDGRLSMSSVGGFINGLGLSIGATVAGGIDLVFHPIDSAKAIGTSVSSAAGYVRDFANNPSGVASETSAGLSIQYSQFMAQS